MERKGPEDTEADWGSRIEDDSDAGREAGITQVGHVHILM